MREAAYPKQLSGSAVQEIGEAGKYFSNVNLRVLGVKGSDVRNRNWGTVELVL